MKSFKLSLKGLPFGNQSFSYELNDDFFKDIDPIEVLGANVVATLNLEHKLEGIVQLSFTFEGTISFPCDRCLEAMWHEVNTTYDLTVKSEGTEVDDSRDGVLVVPSSWQELDLAPIMRDTVLLSVPMVHVHPDGECNPEMMSRLSEHTPDDFTMPDGDDAPTDPRWDALKNLKQD